MVEAAILLRVLHRHHVANVLHHTYRASVAFGVGADGTDVGVADVVTHTTIAHLMPHLAYRSGKRVDAVGALPQQEECQAQGCLTSHARQL